LLIVQISDIHCGPQFRQGVFERAVKEINRMKPNGVIVTGDLTEDGLLDQYRQAKAELERIDAKKILICSGNHDYRSTGYLLFKHFFPSRQVDVEDGVVFVGLSTARPERDDGEAGYRQIMWLKKTLARHKGRRKVVAMHHHVLPVPDTGTDRIRIFDAGDVLRTIAQSHVDLVLCGHRHRPWRWRLEDFTVLNAGTVSSERTRGFFQNSYNIIDIQDGGLKIYLKVVGGKMMDMERIMAEERIWLPKT